MISVKIHLRMAFLYLAIVLVSMGCPSGPSNNPPTPPPVPNTLCTGLRTFNGGALADLKALCPSLNFDELEITGELILPDSAVSSVLTTISANKLTITSAGFIGYLWYGGSYWGAPDDCKWVPAPSLALKVSGDVVIDGNIDLEGRYGVSINSIYEPCKWCNGMNGGDVTITGNTIKLTSKVTNSGGDGALETQFGNHCKSGDSGNLKLETVTTMDLSGATIINQRGIGLDPSKNGYSGTANIAAGGIFTMRDGNIDSSGAMTFSAASTDIWGTIHYGTLNETIGGTTDSTQPTITLLSQLSNTTVMYHQAIELRVEAADVGMGLRGVRVQGLGNNKTYEIADCKTGAASCTASALDFTLTMSLPVNDSTPLQSLKVTAIDNKANTTDAPLITGIAVLLPPETEPNDSFEQAQVLDLDGIIPGTIQEDDSGKIWTSPPPAYFIGDPGMHQNAAGLYKIEDFYKITCCSTWDVTNSIGDIYRHHGINLIVDFQDSAAVQPDIDVYILDQSYVYGGSTKDNVNDNTYWEGGKILSFDHWLIYNASTGHWYSDLGSTWTGKTLYVGIQAWKVPARANYIIYYYK